MSDEGQRAIEAMAQAIADSTARLEVVAAARRFEEWIAAILWSDHAEAEHPMPPDRAGGDE